MLIDCRQAGRTLGLRGPHLARGPDFACHWSTATILLVQPFSYVDDVVLLTPCTSALRTRVVGPRLFRS